MVFCSDFLKAGSKKANLNNKYVINILGGPGVGKSLTAALVFSILKIKGYNTEYVQEFAKELVWLKRYDLLHNQHYVALKQYEMLKNIYKEVDVVITDGSLLHGLYYNRYNLNNYSDIGKTEKFILEKYKEFNNINIFLLRNNKYPYQNEGRMQNIDEAIIIDKKLKELLIEKNIKFIEFVSDIQNFDKILRTIEKQILN